MVLSKIEKSWTGNYLIVAKQKYQFSGWDKSLKSRIDQIHRVFAYELSCPAQNTPKSAFFHSEKNPNTLIKCVRLLKKSIFELQIYSSCFVLKKNCKMFDA